MEQKSNKKKLVVAFALLALIVVASVVTTVVVVLAAQTQTVTSGVKVTYTVIDVSANVKLNTKISGGELTAVQPTAGHTFTPDQDNQNESFTLTDVALTSTNNYVYYEWIVKNNADARKFKATLAYAPTGTDANITCKCKASTSQLAPETNSGFTENGDNIIVDAGSTVYIYAFVQVTDLSKAASLEGNFTLTLDSSDSAIAG